MPDQGLYEERYRLAGSIAASLAVSLVMIGVAVHFSYGTWMALSALAFVSVTVPCLAAAASRQDRFSRRRAGHHARRLTAELAGP